MKNFLMISFLFVLSLLIFSPEKQTSQVLDTQTQCVVVDNDQAQAEVPYLLEQVVAPPRVVQAGIFTFVQDESTAPINDDPVAADVEWGDLLKTYWAELLIGLLAFIKIFVRITPTIKDDAVFARIDSLINALIPNFQLKKKTPQNE
ncbi:MAG: hypothetical protein JXQ80_12920 [Bacteroidales bacterium]|nr:hypothetical protein [Bacteroidales bacterium]